MSDEWIKTLADRRRVKFTNQEPFRFEANLGRLRFVQLGSILAPIKRTKSGREVMLSLAE